MQQRVSFQVQSDIEPSRVVILDIATGSHPDDMGGGMLAVSQHCPRDSIDQVQGISWM